MIEALRQAVEADPRTRAELSRESGIAQSVLCRLVRREVGISADTAERLAAVLGLEIIIRPKRRGKRR